MMFKTKILWRLICYGTILIIAMNYNSGSFLFENSFWDSTMGSDHCFSESECATIVRLPKYGSLEGSINFTTWTNRTIYQFLNVPFAESPSGPRRFKAPVPVKPWNGIRDATKYGTKCPEFNDIVTMEESDLVGKDIEDCLIMAIFSSNLNASLPVMVYIHGGAFYCNNGDHYPPNYIMEADIVLVIVQYRLDALGFLSTNTDEIPGNAGQLDLVQALKFVKENIEHFGGDPNQITLFGQSGGTAMISALMISPSVPEDLFQRAIIQSGSIFAVWAYTTDPLSDAKKIAEEAGFDPNQSVTELNEKFMSMSVLDLLKTMDRYQTKTSLSGLYPYAGRCLTIGGPSNFLSDVPENIVQSYNKSIPIIIGAAKNDGSYLATELFNRLNVSTKLYDKDFMTNYLVNYISRHSGIKDVGGSVDVLSSLTFWNENELSSGDFGTCATGIMDMYSTAVFKSPAFKFAQVMAQSKSSEVYLYAFNYKGEHTRFGYGADVSHYPFSGGVHHSDDLIYLFPDPPNVAKLNEDDTKMAQMLVDLWTSFAISGKPILTRRYGQFHGHFWEPFTGFGGAFLRIDKCLQIDHEYQYEFTARAREKRSQLLKKECLYELSYNKFHPN